MGYLGGKSLLGKEISMEVLKRRKINQIIREPFVGFLNVTEYLKPTFASDINRSLILCINAIKEGWLPPDNIDVSEYNELKHMSQEGIESPLIGFVGFGCSWGGKWFGGFAIGKSRNYCSESKRSLVKRVKNSIETIFEHRNYRNLKPSCELIYCDPPYKDTTGYKDSFDSVKFWEVMREWSKNNTVIISEYRAPSDFKSICHFEHFATQGLDKRPTIEHLFMKESNE